MASQHVHHMQKALTQMNLQFQRRHQRPDGWTGLAILDAILAGERDPAVLAKLRDPRIKADQETIRKSLEGNWRIEHLLVLKQRCRCTGAIAIRFTIAIKRSRSWWQPFAPQVCDG